MNKDDIHSGRIRRCAPVPCVSGTNGLRNVSSTRDEPAETWTGFRPLEGKTKPNKRTKKIIKKNHCFTEVITSQFSSPKQSHTASKQGQFLSSAVTELEVGVTMGIYSKYLHTENYSSHRARQRGRGTAAAADATHTMLIC